MDELPEFLSRAVDTSLEVTIAGSFSRLGYAARRATSPWPDPPRIEGRTVLITGASSGIGRSAAAALAGLGADVWLAGRDRDRLAAATEEATSAAATAAAAAGSSRPGTAHPVVADVVDPDQVGSLVDELGRHGRLDAVVHNAGALFPDYRQAPDGTELTLATHLLAPFRLTWMLRPLLIRAAGGPRSLILTVSSGGMYTEKFDLDRLEMTPADYRGTVAYARAKRAQLVLTHEWARRLAGDGITAQAMHPGWAATPGVDAGLPNFAKLGPVLRPPAEGADTMVWLTATALSPAGAKLEPGRFWHDRRPRGEYYKPSTRRTPAEDRIDGEQLWAWCAGRTGVGGD